MSTTPPSHADPPEHPDPPEREYLEAGHVEPGRTHGRTRYPLIGLAAVAGAALLGGGAWAVAQLMGGGPGAAAGVPDNVLAYVALDLDPSASQKIEALTTLKKFPALDDQLDLTSRDDVRRWVFEQVQEGGDCSGIDYSKDVEPWLGDKMAVAAVSNPEHVSDPLVVLQVTDHDKAESGMNRLFDKCGGGDFAVGFVADYMLVGEKKDVVDAAVSRAEDHPLSEDAAYQAAVERVGDQGVMSFYVSKEGPQAIYDSMIGTLPPGELLPGTSDPRAQIQSSFARFAGLAGTLRFGDGGLELELAGPDAGRLADIDQPPSIGDLPDTTVAALGFGLPDAWGADLEQSLREALGDQTYEDGLIRVEEQTGLDLPGDLETLFGDGAVLALDGQTDFSTLNDSADPSALKGGIRVQGDETQIRVVIEKLLRLAGPEATDAVKLQSAGGHVAIGFDEAYTRKLLDGGDLGDQPSFDGSVPEAEAPFSLFVDFDAADHWLERAAASAGGDEAVLENVRPLSALGASAWAEDDGWHFQLRLDTDN